MTKRPPPRTWINPWPHGPATPGAPAAATWVAALAQHVTATGLHPTTIAHATGLDIRAINDVLHGTRWPTIHTATTLRELAAQPPR